MGGRREQGQETGPEWFLLQELPRPIERHAIVHSPGVPEITLAEFRGPLDLVEARLFEQLVGATVAKIVRSDRGGGVARLPQQGRYGERCASDPPVGGLQGRIVSEKEGKAGGKT